MSVKWLRDKKGISPVIGAVLLVAITVILAAVIASFVFGYSGKLTEAPPHFQARLDKIDNKTKNITIIHAGGDVVDLKDIKIIVKCRKYVDIYDPAAQKNFYDAFGPMDVMIIDVEKDKIYVNGEDCHAVAVKKDLSDLWLGYMVEVIFIHKPSGQVVLKLSGRADYYPS